MTAMILRVAGDSVYTGFCAVSALALGRCALGYLLTVPLGLGIPGVWIALVFEWCYRTVLQRLRLRRTAAAAG
jgi:Na+-driven multidrug efflux pump